MRKSWLILLFVVLLFGVVLAADNSTNSTNSTTTNITSTSNSSSTTSTVNLSKIDKGFSCLSNQVKSDCSGAQNIQDLALTIMASPNVTKQCVDKLKSLKQSGNCFGTSGCTVKETALAVLALNHAGENTKDYENWLTNQTLTSTDMIWYLQQDSNVQSSCRITYDSANYDFVANENKKLSAPAGPCLSLAQSDYWFQVSPSCYDKSFSIVCDQSFIATFLYKQPNSQTVYVLSDTKSATANQPINLQIKSLCFGQGSCDYEGSAWAALALDRTGNKIDNYIPYLISNEESNQQYLPDAFLNMIVDYSEYGSKLLQQQNLNSWLAPSSVYDQFYDTALALIALGNSNQEQVTRSRDWLLNLEQEADGCWNSDNIRDTAISLWALAKRSASLSGTGNTQVNNCQDFGKFCVPSFQCPLDQRSGNYYCSGGLSQTCCAVQNTQTCDQLGGTTCGTGQQCSGQEESASDTQSCCLSTCEDVPTQNQCESAGNICRSSCSSSQQEVASLSCDSSSMVCCGAKQNTNNNGSGSLLWLWILIIILIILLVLAILFRDKLKIWFYKMKSKFKKDDEKSGSTGGNGGFPPQSPSPYGRQPVRAPMTRPVYPSRTMPPQRIPAKTTSQNSSDDIFKKLKEISK